MRKSDRRYVATLIPDSVPFDEVEFQASQGLLPEHPVRAKSAEAAMAAAHRDTGKAVFGVARVSQ
jgi:hypothetical protein